MVANLKNYLVKSLVVLGLSTGEQVQATPNHPFYTHGEYVEAAALHVGDTLFTADGRCVTVAAVCEKDTTARVYNLTVADNSNYFVGTSDVLVHNYCMAKVLSAKAYEKLVARVDKLSPELKAAFMSDFEKAGTDVLNVLNKDNGLDAWKMLHTVGSDARLDVTSLDKLCGLLKSNNFGWDASSFEKTFAKLKKMKTDGKAIAGAIEEGTDEAVELVLGNKLSEAELIGALKKLDDAKINGTAKMMKELCCESDWKAVGAEMVVRTVERENLWGKVAGFEVTHNGVNGPRYIDIMVKEGDELIRVEVKSWSKMYPPTFIKQFVEKDLANVSSLKNMRWVFDGKYGNAAKLKTDIINVLEKSGKSKLNNSGVLKLFDDYAESIGYAGSINNVDELISFMKADSGWFNMIFSLK